MSLGSSNGQALEELVKPITDEPIADPKILETDVDDIKQDVVVKHELEPAGEGDETIDEQELDTRADFPRRNSSVVRASVSSIERPPALAKLAAGEFDFGDPVIEDPEPQVDELPPTLAVDTDNQAKNVQSLSKPDRPARPTRPQRPERPERPERPQRPLAQQQQQQPPQLQQNEHKPQMGSINPPSGEPVMGSVAETASQLNSSTGSTPVSPERPEQPQRPEQPACSSLSEQTESIHENVPPARPQRPERPVRSPQDTTPVGENPVEPKSEKPSRPERPERPQRPTAQSQDEDKQITNKQQESDGAPKLERPQRPERPTRPQKVVEALESHEEAKNPQNDSAIESELTEPQSTLPARPARPSRPSRVSLTGYSEMDGEDTGPNVPRRPARKSMSENPHQHAASAQKESQPSLDSIEGADSPSTDGASVVASSPRKPRPEEYEEIEGMDSPHERSVTHEMIKPQSDGGDAIGNQSVANGRGLDVSNETAKYATGNLHSSRDLTKDRAVELEKLANLPTEKSDGATQERDSVAEKVAERAAELETLASTPKDDSSEQKDADPAATSQLAKERATQLEKSVEQQIKESDKASEESSKRVHELATERAAELEKSASTKKSTDTPATATEPIDPKLTVKDDLKPKSKAIDEDVKEEVKPERKPKPARPAGSALNRFPIETAPAEKSDRPKPKPKLGSRIAALQGTTMFNDLSAAIARGPPGVGRKSSHPKEQTPEESEEEALQAQMQAMPKDPRARAKGPKRRLPASAKPKFQTVTAQLWSAHEQSDEKNDLKDEPVHISKEDSGESNSCVKEEEEEEEEPTQSAIQGSLPGDELADKQDKAVETLSDAPESEDAPEATISDVAATKFDGEATSEVKVSTQLPEEDSPPESAPIVQGSILESFPPDSTSTKTRRFSASSEKHSQEESSPKISTPPVLASSNDEENSPLESITIESVLDCGGPVKEEQQPRNRRQSSNIVREDILSTVRKAAQNAPDSAVE